QVLDSLDKLSSRLNGVPPPVISEHIKSIAITILGRIIPIAFLVAALNAQQVQQLMEEGDLGQDSHEASFVDDITWTKVVTISREVGRHRQIQLIVGAATQRGPDHFSGPLVDQLRAE